jgi:CBS-domain-containing membrane protein
MGLHDIPELLGFTRREINYREKLISIAGGFLGIFFVFMSSQWLLGPEMSVMIVPSMGASAVLLFAAPQAPFSQPWNVIGGHAISAVIGVACWQWIPNLVIASSISVGLAIGAMYFTRCIHPPGGATALAAVIGSDELHQLGFAYEFKPVLLNAVTILLVAIVFNNLFKWRRYPAGMNVLADDLVAEDLEVSQILAESVSEGDVYKPIKHEDFVYALSHIDTFVDISEADLVKIYNIATHRRDEGD